MKNLIAIVGRPNVGKSTLFNRLIQRRQAITHENSGVTRDRQYGTVEWDGIHLPVVDTGGYVQHSKDVFEEAIKKQVEIALEEADYIFFLVDVKTGITDLDLYLARILQKSDKIVYPIVNKVDNTTNFFETGEFYNLGLGDYYSISANDGSGTGDLLDDVVEHARKNLNTEQQYPDIPHLSVVGRPNAGKSSFINILLGDERNIVTSIAGTTRDSVNSHYKKFGKEFLLIDTAGLRKRSKSKKEVEFFSTMRAIKSIENCDVSLLILDAEQGIEAQDVNIFRLIKRYNKGVVAVINKWDLIENKEEMHSRFLEEAKIKFSPFIDIPFIFTSVINKKRIYNVLEKVEEVYNNKHRHISTAKLNEVLLKEVEKNPHPASGQAQYIKIKYVTQLEKNYPAFVFFSNNPGEIKESYKRFLENKIRENFNFTGVPIKIYTRQK